MLNQLFGKVYSDVMRILTCLFVLFLCFTSCGRVSEPEYIQYADKVMNDFVKFAYKKYGLVLHGSGGGFMDQINKVNMFFYTKEQLSIPEMRILLISLTNDFLEKINSGDNSEEYLAEYPFGFDRLCFSIVIYDQNYKRIVNPGSSIDRITFAYTSGDKINYFILNEEKDNLQKVFEEYYSDALMKVNHDDS